MKYKELKEMIAELEEEYGNLDEKEISFTRDEMKFNVIAYSVLDDEIIIDYIPDDAKFMLTDKGIFYYICIDNNVFKNPINNPKLESIWTLFKYLMCENGWYVDGDDARKEQSGNPVEFLKRAFNESGVRINDETIEKIYTDFLDDLKKAGYTKNA